MKVFFVAVVIAAFLFAVVFGAPATYTVKNGVLTITGEMSGSCYNQQCAWQKEIKDKDSIKSIVVVDSTVIDAQGFLGFKYVKSVSIPDNCYSIGSEAFKDCSSLESISCHATKIGSNAFNGCTALNSVSIDSPAVTILKKAFSGSSLKTLKVTGVIDLQESALASSPNLTTIDGTFTTLIKKAFDGYSGAADLKIHAENLTIKSRAFEGSDTLETLRIDGYVKSIDNFAFSTDNVEKGKLKSISIESVGNISSYIFCTSADSTKCLKTVKSFEVTGDVDYIAPYATAFANVTSFTVGGFTRELAKNAFYYSDFEPNKLPVSYYYTFGSIEKIGSNIFITEEKKEWNTNIHFYVKGSIDTIKEKAFSNVRARGVSKTRVFTFVVDGTIKSIGKGAFYDSDALTLFKVGSYNDTLPESMFEIPEKDSNAMNNWKSLIIPGVRGYGNRTFYNCHFTQLEVPDTVESIGYEAFSSCQSLKKIVIPASVNSISLMAFSWCTNLKKIYYQGNDSYTGKELFRNCNKGSITVTVYDTYNYSTFSTISKPVVKTPIMCFEEPYEFAFGTECKYCSSAMLGCTTCSNEVSGLKCESCSTGFELVNGTCVGTCSSVFGEGCKACSGKACTNCTSEVCCGVKKYLWKDGKCVDPATVFGEGCLESVNGTCSLCVAQTCCAENQYFDYVNTKCVNCAEGCEKCTAAGCIGCEKSKVVDGDSCVDCSAVFGETCSECDSIHCTSCDNTKDYYLVNGMCKLRADVFGKYCKTVDKNECKECNSTSVALVDGKCKECSSLFGQSCSECTKDGCTECSVDGKQIVNGVCVDAATAFGPGCVSFDASDATKCGKAAKGYIVDGYSGLPVSCDALVNGCKTRSIPVMIGKSSRDNIKVLYNGEEVEATAVDPNCKTWDSKGHKCSECKDGYTKYGAVCKSCSEIHGEDCTKCTFTSCTKCNPGFAFLGECVPCDEFAPHCEECDDNGACTSCRDGLYPKDGACVDCQTKVGGGCTLCTGSDDSVTCAPGNCVADTCCSDNTKLVMKYGNLACGTCDDLVKNCGKCTTTECLSCKDDTMDVDGDNCVLCSKLFDGCAKCGGGECTACSDANWVLTPNGCYSEEPPKPVHPSSVAPQSVVSECSRIGNNVFMLLLILSAIVLFL